MTTKSSDLAVDARFDRSLAWRRGNSCRYLIVEIAAPAADADPNRRPHDIAIAIGATSSTTDWELEAARRLTRGLIDRMGPSDTVSVVSFAAETRLELAPTIADADGKATAMAAVDRIECRPGCDFAGGWLAAAEACATAMETRTGSRGTVFIVSNGRADCGLLRPEELALHAAELRARDVSTVAVAVGPECDLSLLVAVDDPMGVRAGFAAAAGNEVVDALIAGRTELLPVVAAGAQLIVTTPPATAVSALGPELLESNGQELSVSLGDVRASSHRLVVFKLILPESEVGATAEFTVELEWLDRAGHAQRLAPITRRLTFASGKDNTPQPRDMRATLTVLGQWRLSLLRELISLNRQGRWREAEAHLVREMKFLERYAHGVPNAAPLMGQLRLALPMVHRPWRDRLSPSAS